MPASRIYEYDETFGSTSVATGTAAAPITVVDIGLGSTQLASQRWAILFSSAHAQTNDATRNAFLQLRNQTDNVVYAMDSCEPGTQTADAEWFPFGGCAYTSWGAAPGDKVFAIEGYNETGTGAHSARISAVLPIQLGANDVGATSLTDSTSASTTYVTKCTITLPTTGTYHIFPTITMQSTSTSTPCQVQVVGSAAGTVFDSGSNLLAKDVDNQVSYSTVFQVTATAGDTFTLQFRRPSGTGTITGRYASLVAFYLPDMPASYWADDSTARTTTSTTEVARNAAGDATIASPGGIAHALFGATTLTRVANTTPVEVRADAAGGTFGQWTARGTSSANRYAIVVAQKPAGVLTSSTTLSWKWKAQTAGTANSDFGRMGAWQLVSSGTSAPAGDLSVSVAANNPSITASGRPAAGDLSVVVTAYAASITAVTKAAAAQAGVTVTANDVSSVKASGNPPATQAAITATANDATPKASGNASAGQAAVTVTANNATPTNTTSVPATQAAITAGAINPAPTTAALPQATQAAVTATAQNGSAKASGNAPATQAAVTTTANDASAKASGNAAATQAAVTVAAQNPSPTTAALPQATQAAVSVAAQNATPATGTSAAATQAAVSVTAQDASAKASGNAASGTAAVAVAAQNGSGKATASIPVTDAAVAVQAQSPAPTTARSAAATAASVSVTGQGPSPTTAASPGATAAAVTVAAQQPGTTVTTRPLPGTAAVSVAAQQPSFKGSGNAAAGQAAVAVSAFQPTPLSGAIIFAPAIDVQVVAQTPTFKATGRPPATQAAVGVAANNPAPISARLVPANVAAITVLALDPSVTLASKAAAGSAVCIVSTQGPQLDVKSRITPEEITEGVVVFDPLAQVSTIVGTSTIVVNSMVFQVTIVAGSQHLPLLRYWDGSQWVRAQLKRWDGAAWVADERLKIFDPDSMLWLPVNG